MAVQIPVHMKDQKTCMHHKGRQLEFYCENCKELVCPRCLSSVHKKHAVCELSEIIPQKERNIKNFIDRTEQNDLIQVQKYIKSSDTLLQDNTKTFDKLSRQLKIQTEKLKHDLDMLSTQTLSLYQKMEEDNTKLIQKYRHDLEMYDKQLKQQIRECKAVLQRGSPIQIYDKSCEIHSPTSLPVKPVLDTASFTPNKNPQGHLEVALGKVVSLGQGQTSEDQGQSSKQQQTEIKGKKGLTENKLLSETKVVEEWKFPCRIYSICPTTDGQVWTSCYRDTLTLLDRTGEVIQAVKHKVGINDISLSPTTHKLWVCDGENNIMELISGRLTRRFKPKETPRSLCVTASNHIILGLDKRICKFTTQGQMVLTTFVYSPQEISECPVTHNVAVIDNGKESDDGDGNKHVVVMDTDFQGVFVYRGNIPSTYKQTPLTGGEPFNPWGTVYDNVGNLIIGDKNNCRVLLVSGGGIFLQIIYTDINSISAVGVDNKDFLWAVFGQRCVKLLKYINRV